MKVFVKSICALGLSLSSLAFAELDPELAKTAIQNKSGLGLGVGLMVGQANATAPGSSGAAFGLTVTPTFVMARDSWNRFEFGVEVGSGSASYARKGNGSTTDFDVGMKYYLLPTFGYGYSIGGGVFAVTRFGLGFGSADFEAESIKSDGTTTGTILRGGFDLVASVTESMELMGGLSVTQHTYSFSDATVDELPDVKVDVDVQYNLLALQAGARFVF